MRAAWLLVLLLAPMALAAGSWVGTAPGVQVNQADRESVSAPLAPPEAISTGRIVSVVWRLRLPPGAGVRGRLCHPQGCVALDGVRGRSEALAGLSAGEPLHFHFALLPDQRKAVAVEGLQVIVNYR